MLHCDKSRTTEVGFSEICVPATLGSEAIPSCPDPLVPTDALRPPAEKGMPFPSSNFICFTGRLVVPEKP